MKQEFVTALVTGANRGLGRQFAVGLVARGAKVYAATDVTVLVNNAGISTRVSLLSGSLEDVRLEMETHYFGTLDVTRAFVPIIERNGGGAILNVLSVLSWVHLPESCAYSAAKAAAWALTDALRQELARRATFRDTLPRRSQPRRRPQTHWHPMGYPSTATSAYGTGSPRRHRRRGARYGSAARATTQSSWPPVDTR